MKKLSFLLLLIVALFASCEKENIEKFTPSETILEEVTASFRGIVVDEAGQPVEGAAVSFGENVRASSDEKGIFSISNLKVPKDKAYFTIRKGGFFLGSRTVVPHPNDVNQLKIRLLSNTSQYSFENTSGGEVTLAEGGKVTFDANSVGTEDGNPYTGTVYVSAKKIDPTTMDGITSMPGDLRAIDSQSQERILKSYGMMAVELKGSTGEKLQLLSGKTAQLTFEIPADLVATTPATIPLWYFDEVNGNWVEDGEAVLSGNEYVGAVKHFSFWNTDAKFDTVHFGATMVNEDGDPFQNLHVQLEIIGGGYDGWTATGWTTDAGWTGGLVPAEGTLRLYVKFPNCEKIFIQAFTTGTTDIDLGNIVVPAVSGPAFYTVTGRLTDCDTIPVSNGYVILQLNGDEWYDIAFSSVDADGTFSKEIGLCNTTIVRLQGYDIANLKESPTKTLDLNIATDAGDLIACDAIDEFLTVEVTGSDSYLFTGNDLYLILQASADSIRAYHPGDASFFTMNFTGTEIGQYDCNGLFRNGIEDLWEWTGTVTVVNYPNTIGEYIEGSYTGILDNDSNTPLNGAFRIKRE